MLQVSEWKMRVHMAIRRKLKYTATISLSIVCGAVLGGCLAALSACIGAWSASGYGLSSLSTEFFASTVSSGAITGRYIQYIPSTCSVTRKNITSRQTHSWCNTKFYFWAMQYYDNAMFYFRWNGGSRCRVLELYWQWEGGTITIIYRKIIITLQLVHILEIVIYNLLW